MSNNVFELVETLRVAIDQLNQILVGGENDTVTIGGVTKPSITKALTDATAAATALAQAAQLGAEAARDAAELSAGLFESTTAGLAAVAEGGYFSVPSIGDETFVTLYRKVSGTASEVTKYPSTKYLEFISKTLITGYAWTLQDAVGRIALGVRDDGDVRTGSFHGLTILNDLPSGYAWALTDENGHVALGVRTDGTVVMGDVRLAGLVHDTNGITGLGGEYAWAINDSLGRIALGVRTDGTVVMGTAIVNEINKSFDQAMVYRSGGTYSAQINFINNTGQSLGEGSTPATALTTSQEYDNVGFPARALNPTSLVPLTVANTQVGSRGESPMYGTLGHVKELIAEENGLLYPVNDYQLAACNNAYGGYSITQLNKGTVPYQNAMTQVQSLADIAALSGRSASFQAVTWTQGEADAVTVPPMDIGIYKGHLKQLAEDYNTDGRAITGQHNQVRFISYQMCSRSRNIAVAQLEASNESDLIYIATPTYIFNFPQDDVHVDAESSKWLGGYYGLVYKRVVVDGQDWKPLQPVAHAVVGGTLDLIFNKDGLTIDTTMVPAQPDYGFQVVDGAGVVQTLSSVSVIGPNRVRLVLASGTIAPGWAVRYGFANAVGKGTFVGGCGNLRDRQGDRIVYSAISKPMHNWCVLFNYPL
jgi:hypothetical protein